MVNFILVAPPECQLDLCVKVKLGDLFMSKMCLELDTNPHLTTYN